MQQETVKLHSGLTGDYHAICHYSYNLPLTTNRDINTTEKTIS